MGFKQFIETPESSEVFRTVVGRLGRREITISCHAYNPAVGARLGKSKHVWKTMTGFRFLPKDVIPVRRDEPRYYFYRVERDIFSLRLKKVLSGQPTNYRLKKLPRVKGINPHMCLNFHGEADRKLLARTDHPEGYELKNALVLKESVRAGCFP